MAMATPMFKTTSCFETLSNNVILANNYDKRKNKKKKTRLTRCELSEDWKLSDGPKKKFVWKHHGDTRLKKRTSSDKMEEFLAEERRKQKYQKHVVEAIRIVRQLSSKPAGSYNIRHVLSRFIGRLSFKEMCVVLKEQKGWREASEFFSWMKLQVHV
ncbi:pentatricopeptide repeat-containing protein At5g27270-like [Cryptomeria japonica]|uniref:pentatricopeptide repeat-containing protein At5g27270-like n=1 Tax=Cryptomeria japonica TaxID=3369 RepID=UPI0027D9F4CD|nr:pentatricopeptide repeat-containing protein At5g27270-like [Cryptomeria japonica]